MKKKFEVPELTIITFSFDDIITDSVTGPQGIGSQGEEGNDDPGD